VKQDYPFLKEWKRIGFNNLPRPPESVLLEQEISEIKKRQKILKAFKDQIEGSQTENPDGLLNEIIEEAARQSLNEKIGRLKELYSAQAAGRDFKLRLKFLRGEISRKQAQAQWAGASLPRTRGGKAVGNKNTLVLLKICYLEIQAAIKELRSAIGIPFPCKKGDWKAQTLYWEDLKSLPGLAGLAEIFTEDEIRSLATIPSVSETALQILQKRLKRCLPQHLSARRLKDLFKETTITEKVSYVPLVI
jgi:hypothetical protein